MTPAAYQDENVWLHKRQLCKHHPGLLPTRQVPDFDGMCMAWKSIATQCLARKLVINIKFALSCIGESVCVCVGVVCGCVGVCVWVCKVGRDNY